MYFVSCFQKVLVLERQENRSEYSIQMVTFKLVLMMIYHILYLPSFSLITSDIYVYNNISKVM
jgi:hypothetical protein